MHEDDFPYPGAERLFDKKYCPKCTKVLHYQFDSTGAGYSYKPILLILKNGKFGKFFACPNWPNCQYTKSIPKNKIVDIDYEDELRPF